MQPGIGPKKVGANPVKQQSIIFLPGLEEALKKEAAAQKIVEEAAKKAAEEAAKKAAEEVAKNSTAADHHQCAAG